MIMGENEYVRQNQDPAETCLTLGMDMLLKVQGLKGDYKTKLVGLRPFECIIMSMPRIPGFIHTVGPEAHLQVRYMAEGTLYGFNTCVIGHITKPFPLLFAAYPQRLERYELRKDTRLECFMPSALFTPARGYDIYVLDLSKGGCRANADSGEEAPDTAVGKTVLLRMPLCGLEQVIVAKAEVRNMHILGKILSLGLAFQCLEPCASKNLESFLEKGRLYS